MKGIKPVILLILLMVFITLGANTATAAINVFVNATLPYDVLYQGQLVSANVTVKNNENFPIRVYSVGVHYDWMPENVYTSVDFGGSYVQVESNGVTSPGQLLISCDTNVTPGYHSFYYKVEMTWYNAYMASWVNETVVQPGTIFVESPLKPQALQELQFANKTLAEAKKMNYSSSRGRTNIATATDLLNDGWSAFNSADYARAINDSVRVVTLVSDAKVAEKNYRDNVSDVERLVAAVNEKLGTISATADPDTKAFISEAFGYLNKTRVYIDAEDFTTALTNANLADAAADKAIQQQFYASLKANQTEAEKVKARAALDKAQASLDGAPNMTSVSAQSLMKDARIKFGDAAFMFDRQDYGNATITANVAASLVSQANADEAAARLLRAKNEIASVGELRSPGAKGMLDNASALYNQSEREYNVGNVGDSIRHADEAYALAGNTSAVEQKYREENPLSAVTPGFGVLAALLALGILFIAKDGKP